MVLKGGVKVGLICWVSIGCYLNVAIPLEQTRSAPLYAPGAMSRRDGSRFIGQYGGFAKVGSGFDYAANLSCCRSIA